MDLKCNFFHGQKYCSSCNLHPREITKPATSINSVRGKHITGRKDENVQELQLKGVIHYVPRGLTAIFSNLTILCIREVGLKSICREDLTEFRNLEKLSLADNRLAILPDDLFMDTPKLTTISFFNNFIVSMSSKLFQPIIKNDFKCIDFKRNIEIDAIYSTTIPVSVKSVADLMELIDSKCSKPPEPATSAIRIRPNQICQENFVQGFESLFESGKCSDFTIIINGLENFRVHKSILAAQCKGFAEFLDKNPGADKMHMISTSTEAVEQFLRFFYTGKLENFLENACEIFVLASKMNAMDLKEALEIRLMTELGNGLDLLQALSMAYKFNAENLKQAVFKFTCRALEFSKPFDHYHRSLTNDFKEFEDLVKYAIRCRGPFSNWKLF